MTSAGVDELEEVVAASWRDALGLESLPPDANLFAIGGDSMVAVVIAADLGQRLGVEVGLADLLDHPTLSAFTDRLRDVVAAGSG